MVFNRAKALTLSAPGEEAGAIGFPPPPGRSPPVKGRRDPRDGASQGPPSPPRGAESSRATRPNDQSRARDCCSLPIRWRVHSERTIAKGNPKGSPTSLAGGKGEEPLRVKGAREGERRGPRKAFYSPSSAHPAVRSLGPSSDLKGSGSPHMSREAWKGLHTMGHHRFQHLFRLERPSAVTARHSSVPSRLNRRTDSPEATSNGSSRTELDCCSEGTTRPGL